MKILELENEPLSKLRGMAKTLNIPNYNRMKKESLAMMIRERFRLKGKVRTLSAEGRLSAVFLIALPCLLLIWLWWANPDYLRPIFEWQYGAAFIGGVVFWVLVGIIWIWRIIQIKF